ncbi:hypothetical protein [Kitasatospora sp. NBC_01266]|jgi:hypothetical protein|uniref:hypothetical protein n=1 Tax=Kitasatospora sp. NBC_01266 TaxID=2903572 RepID=UPI002E337D96|nr:hypothetical protein [Kitasatospora sp. NBC_01266]
MALIRGRRAGGGRAPANGDDQETADDLSSLTAGMEHWDLGPPEQDAARQARGRRRMTALIRDLAHGNGTGHGEPGRREAGRGVGVGIRGLTDRLLALAPRIPVRDLATLRAQHPHVSGPEELADRLVAGASRASSAVGAGVGAAAMAPVPPAMTVELAAETLAIAAVEIKLIAELHEVYGQRPAGTGSQRATAYLASWANRRGIDRVSLTTPGGLLALSAGSRVRRQVAKRLTRSSLRKLPTLTPFLLGAVAGARLNRHDTRRLAARVRADLRRGYPGGPGHWAPRPR